MSRRFELLFRNVLILVTLAQTPAGLLSFAAPALAGQPPQESSGPKSKKDEKAQPVVQVRGKVVDRDGKGVANADVIIAGPKRDTKQTDSTGSFTFEGPHGRYTLTIKAGEKSKSFPAEIANHRLEPATLIFE